MSHQNKKNIFLIINKFAGHGIKRESAINKAILWLQQNAGTVKFKYTEYPGHATEMAIQAVSSGFDIVVAVGGDGTVNEVAQGLIGTIATMGIIPVGSGNGLARELGIPMNIFKSARTLIEGKVQQIDVCRINNQRFLCTSGIGFDAQVADKMSKATSRGFWRYIQLTIQESIAFKPFKIKMKVGDEVIEKPVFLVTFANAPQFGNNARIAPNASMTDGLIDIVVVNPFYKIWLPLFGIGLFTRLIPKFPFVDTYRATQIELELTGTNIYHFDGEPGKLDIPAIVSLISEKLNVIKGRC